MNIPPHLIAFLAYMLLQKLVKDKSNGIQDIVGPDLAGWLPVGAALLIFIVGGKLQQSRAAQATGKLLGITAPDFEMEFRGADGSPERKTLMQLIKDSPLPTIVDFYQNF